MSGIFASIRNVLTDEFKVNTVHGNQDGSLNIKSNGNLIGNLNDTEINFTIKTDVTSNSIVCATDGILFDSSNGKQLSSLTVGGGIIQTKGSLVPSTHNVDTIGGMNSMWRSLYVNEATMTSMSITSDSRLKNDIRNIDTSYCYNLIEKLRPVSYSFIIDEDKRTSFGLIAQEVEGIIGDQKLKLHTSPKDNTDYHSLNYIELISPLIKIIQDLSRRVEELEKK